MTNRVDLSDDELDELVVEFVELEDDRHKRIMDAEHVARTGHSREVMAAVLDAENPADVDLP